MLVVRITLVQACLSMLTGVGIAYFRTQLIEELISHYTVMAIVSVLLLINELFLFENRANRCCGLLFMLMAIVCEWRIRTHCEPWKDDIACANHLFYFVDNGAWKMYLLGLMFSTFSLLVLCLFKPAAAKVIKPE